MAALRAIREFGDAHDRMASGMKGDMRMGATDIATLRMLIMRADSGQHVTPADIARHLRISTASTTKLLDRLSASGHVARISHPSDRRARLVVLTEKSRTEFFRLFGQHLAAIRLTFERFSDEELDAATRVLRTVSEAISPG